MQVVHDLGPEFTGEELQELLRSYGIKAKPITAKNPQANAICERMHFEIINVTAATKEQTGPRWFTIQLMQSVPAIIAFSMPRLVNSSSAKT
ncbi:hypothetical protein PF003_g20769 [Phytophthora fragariae]|nr:hypothetical protein PF003_g20769 [Phytophthora fragariae]